MNTNLKSQAAQDSHSRPAQYQGKRETLLQQHYWKKPKEDPHWSRLVTQSIHELRITGEKESETQKQHKPPKLIIKQKPSKQHDTVFLTILKKWILIRN